MALFRFSQKYLDVDPGIVCEICPATDTEKPQIKVIYNKFPSDKCKVNGIKAKDTLYKYQYINDKTKTWVTSAIEHNGDTNDLVKKILEDAESTRECSWVIEDIEIGRSLKMVSGRYVSKKGN